MAWARRNGPSLGLVAALLAAGAMLLVLTRDLTFFQDTWEFLMNRRDFSVDALMRPHNEHIVVLPAAIEIVILHVFGMSSALPEYLLLIAMILASAALLFVYARRRIDPWLALMATLLLLFLGPAWQDLLWPFELSFVGSVLFGLAMLLALDRDDRKGDIAACVFLVLSAGFSSLGLSFMAAAAVSVWLRRRERGLGRIWVAAVPAALFAVWYLGWGRDAESHLTLGNVLDSPRFVVEGMAASLESLLGLSDAPIEGIATVGWGQPLLVAAVLLVVFQQVRRPGFSEGFWVVGAATLTNWVLTAFNYIPGREPTTGRYMYAAGALTLLVAIELLRGLRVSRNALLIAGVVTLAAVASNIHFFRDGRNWLRHQTELTRANVSAIEISKRTIDPNFFLTPEIAGTPSLIDISPDEYLEAAEDFGSPAYTPEELAAAPEVARRRADLVLAQALPVSTETIPGGYGSGPKGGRCLAMGAAASGSSIELSPGATRIEVAPGPEASFKLRRFAVADFPVPSADLPGDSLTTLRIPRDEASQPWHLRVDADQRVRVCG
jgi:hypothetical protein